MFSLIVTIVSIALVAALALATLFYGGSSFNDASSRSAAAGYINQGQQVLGAAEAFKMENDRWPDTMQELVDTQYLKSIPSVNARNGSALGAAAASGEVRLWEVVSPGRPVFRLPDVQPGSCVQVNNLNFKVPGVLRTLRASWASQCYSPLDGQYSVVVTKDPQSLEAALPGAVTDEELPAPGSARWVIRPGSSEVGSGMLPGVEVSSGTGGATQSSPVSFAEAGVAVPVEFTNSSGDTLTFVRAPYVDNTGSFTVTSNCGATLAAGQACTAYVTLKPGSVAGTSGALVFETTTSRTTVPLVNAVASSSQVQVSTSSGGFAATKPGVPSTQSFTLTNNGATPLACAAPQVTGSTSFTASSTCPAQLQPGQSCTVTSTFTPDAPGTHTATLGMPCSAGDVPLSGEGLTLQEATPSLSTLNFPDTALGASADLTVSLENTGTYLLQLLSVPRIESDATGAFSVVSTTCGATLAAGTLCEATVRFAPTVEGVAAGVLAVDTDASGSPQRITLAGRGLALPPAGILTVTTNPATSPLQVTFGSVTLGQYSESILTVRNTGNASLTLDAPSLPVGVFTKASSTCPGTLPAQFECNVTVRFAPVSPVASTADFTFSSSAGTQVVALSGTGSGASVRYENEGGSAISRIDFPATSVGSNSAPVTVTIRNEGNVALVFSGTPTTAAPFSVQASTCTDATLQPSGSCSVTVVFSPAAAQAHSGSLVLSTNAYEPSTLALNGTGNVLGVAAVSAGAAHTVVVRTDGSLWTSGQNTYGQLGDGTNANRNTFARVLTGVATAAVGAVGSTTVALKTDGSVWTAGRNNQGQLGAGGGAASRNTFGVAPVLTGVAKVFVGSAHMFALKQDNTLWAAGYNGAGALGDGTYTNSPSFKQIIIPGTVVDVFAGGNHSLVLTSDGALRVAGVAANVGIGGTGYHTSFTQVSAGPGAKIVRVSGGEDFSFVLRSDGVLAGAGRNTSGQLGTGTSTNVNYFVQVLTGVSDVVGGTNHSVALKSDGTLWAAGSNSMSQLGAGGSRLSFGQVPGISGVRAIAAGQYHSLALTQDDSLWVTGYNGAGQLGTADTVTKTTFTKVLP